MNPITTTQDPIDDLSQVLTQLCNRTNLRIIQLLLTQNITMNCVVSRRLGISSQLTSKRLKQLVNAGLVVPERIFKQKIYRLNKERFNLFGLSLDLLLRDVQC